MTIIIIVIVTIICLALLSYIAIFRIRLNKKTKQRNYIFIGNETKTYFTSFGFNTVMILVLLVVGNGYIYGLGPEHELIMIFSVIISLLLIIITLGFYFPLGYLTRDDRMCKIYPAYQRPISFKVDDIVEIIVRQRPRIVDYYFIVYKDTAKTKTMRIVIEESLGGLREVLSLYKKRTQKEYTIYPDYIARIKAEKEKGK